MKAVLTISVIAFFIIAGRPALGQMWNYSPLVQSERGKSFQMKHIELGPDGAPFSLTVPAGPSGSHFDLKREGRSLILNSVSGKDASLRNWRVDLKFGGCSFPSDFYVGDLDRNGIDDLVMLVPTCGNGLAPSVHFFALLFDEKGRPVTFEADGYFESLPNGIDALVDLNHDGKADLIYMSFDDGYWITNIYRCENARWHRIKGQLAGREYPLFTRFTNRPNRKAVEPQPNRHPFAPDLSNDTPLMAGQLTSFRIPEKTGTDAELDVLDSNGSHNKCTPAYWYGSVKVVLDGPEGRQISDLSRENKESVFPILNKIISGKLRVLLYGKRYRDKCSPEILWATENN